MENYVKEYDELEELNEDLLTFTPAGGSFEDINKSILSIFYDEDYLLLCIHPSSESATLPYHFCGNEDGEVASLDHAAASALCIAVRHIINERQTVDDKRLVISCDGGVTLTLGRRPNTLEGHTGPMETFLAISKDGIERAFIFSSDKYSFEVNGQVVTKTYHSDLMQFALTITDCLISHILSDENLSDEARKAKMNFIHKASIMAPYDMEGDFCKIHYGGY